MSAVETLPPDQRAVLQLILKQGRGYADLSGLLKIDEAAVRARALAGLETLGDGAGQALSPERRAQVADYLLGQQDDAARTATRSYLDDSAAARRWAGALHAQLSPVARHALPELPASAPSTNGHTVADPEVPETPAPPVPPAAEADPAAHEEPPTTAPRRERTASPAFRPRPGTPAPAPRRSSSKLGGIVLIAGLAVLIAVLAIVLLNGGDDDDPSGSASPQTQAQGTSQAAGRDSGGATAPQVLAQVNLTPSDGGGDAVGIGWVQRVDGRPMIAVQVQRIAPNGEQDVYAAWLRGTDGGTRFLGFVPRQVGRARTFTVSATLPDDVDRYDQVLVTREPITTTATPTRPQDVVLSGTLRLRG